jgi:hypothetical protein
MRNLAGGGWNRTGLSKRVLKSRIGRFMITTAAQSFTRTTRHNLPLKRKMSADDVLHEANTLYDRWPKLPVSDKRKIVEALIEKITIGDGEIDIMFSHLPSSEELCKSQLKLIPKCR